MKPAGGVSTQAFGSLVVPLLEPVAALVVVVVASLAPAVPDPPVGSPVLPDELEVGAPLVDPGPVPVALSSSPRPDPPHARRREPIIAELRRMVAVSHAGRLAVNRTRDGPGAPTCEAPAASDDDVQPGSPLSSRAREISAPVGGQRDGRAPRPGSPAAPASRDRVQATSW